MISFENIERAYKVLKPVVHHTPLLSSRTLNERSGNEIYFKAENFQRIGAFKFRGAYHKLSTLSDEQKRRGVIAHSSGNHAQGVALASKLFGVRAVVVMPENSVKSKVEATKGYGAEVVFCGTKPGEREAMTDDLLKKHGFTMVHPYMDEALIAGQGTLVIEVREQLPQLDYLFVPVGGGGLISGCAIAAKALFPGVRVIGVETEGANDAYQSFRAGKIVRLEKVETIADGMRTPEVGGINFEIILKYVDDVVTISDAEIFPAMKFFYERMKIVVEPTGAVATAAAMKNAMNITGKRICCVISGGNVDAATFREMLAA
jgi:threonine dehydratase